MIKLILTRESTRPNDQVPFYAFDSADMAIYNQWIALSLLLTMGEVIDPSGLVQTRTWEFDITDSATSALIYSDTGFDSIAAKTRVHDTANGITRGTLNFNVFDNDVLTETGSFPEKT